MEPGDNIWIVYAKAGEWSSGPQVIQDWGEETDKWIRRYREKGVRIVQAVVLEVTEERFDWNTP